MEGVIYFIKLFKLVQIIPYVIYIFYHVDFKAQILQDNRLCHRHAKKIMVHFLDILQYNRHQQYLNNRDNKCINNTLPSFIFIYHRLVQK
jgi:DNA topoisomerase VI subunit A